MNQDKNNLSNLRHSTSHLLAAAVMELWPNAKRAIGPATENGFYFDFDFGNEKISEEDFPKIEAKMLEILPSWETFERQELSAEEAKNQYINNPYKNELIKEFTQNEEKVSFYKSGEFWDLCKGGHCEQPSKELKHFKLISVAGAYWRGNEKNPMLTRIYGISFKSKEELDTHFTMLEEAKKRDHRKLGQELNLFFIDERVGKGLIMWLPNGTIIKDEIEELVKKKEKEAGYVRVSTPHIAKEELFTLSGHLPYYKDSMYPPMIMDDGAYYLRAMNCPHHHTIYLHNQKSYKELPLRLAEYGTCYRNELSGTLAGLLRVRGMTMNDAHIYCRKDQIKNEFKNVIKLTMEYFKIFGLEDYWFRLSKWNQKNTEKYIDEPENWEYTEQILREVLEELNVKFVEAENEAAFYGPKVDVQFKSIVGREETMSTIQLDFAAKKRFGLSYIDQDGKENNDVFVIHRAPLSVHERFIAFLIEHYAGKFPVWLSPLQIMLIPIADRHIESANKIKVALALEGIRVEVDNRSESMQSKIRDATLQKVPFLGIMGDRESNIDNLTASIRTRGGQDLGQLSIDLIIQKVKEEIDKKA
ncbi:MAG: threonine--tRNA ligase [Candidatus Levybacteria bacterium]|nr:threonine--tRNA ligase [Candidatus Levybacteria bacterium]